MERLICLARFLGRKLVTFGWSMEIGGRMAKLTFDQGGAALLVVDPYNDFISAGGKLWERLKAVAEANHCVPHLSKPEES
jgi:hypothetical protein